MRIILLTILVFLSVFTFKEYIYPKAAAEEINAFRYFPLSESDADYIITEIDGVYSLTYYKNGIANTNQNTTDTLSIFISNPPSDIDTYINKKVSVAGNFVEGVPFCKGACPNYVGIEKRPVVEIQTLVVKN